MDDEREVDDAGQDLPRGKKAKQCEMKARRAAGPSSVCEGANPSLIHRPSPVPPHDNNNIAATSSLLPTTLLIDIDRYTLLYNADSQPLRLEPRHPPVTVPQQTLVVS